MSLISIDALEALENRKNNPVREWGNRFDSNRVEPLAQPEFSTAFQLQPGEKIFTIGSCFARSVEAQLIERGFQVPARDLFRKPVFNNVNAAVLNNYGTPSIFNELAWALDPEKLFDPERHIVEAAGGKYVDLHLAGAMKPLAKEILIRQRHAIHETTAEVKDCRVVIITLGLVELWYDKEQATYLNAPPLPSIVKHHSGRFELRVLDFQTAYNYMEQALALLSKHCRADQKIILTVSPVPIDSTFQDMDVMVANTYSKSCLRTVAEHLCQRNDHVHYFPSYESVILSDRELAWQNDLIHVTDELVRFNVTRMLDRYCPTDSGLQAAITSIDAGGIPVALELARGYKGRTDADSGHVFFAHFEELTLQSADFAMEAARFYLQCDELTLAENALNKVPLDYHPVRRPLLAARLQLADGDAKAALATIEPLTQRPRMPGPVWKILLFSYVELGRLEEARQAVLRWMKQMPNMEYHCLVTLADALTDKHPQEAIGYFEQAFANFEIERNQHAFRYAEALVATGDMTKAIEFLKDVEAETYVDRLARDRLLMATGKSG